MVKYTQCSYQLEALVQDRTPRASACIQVKNTASSALGIYTKAAGMGLYMVHTGEAVPVSISDVFSGTGFKRLRISMAPSS